jgi:hypothetical protein
MQYGPLFGIVIEEPRVATTTAFIFQAYSAFGVMFNPKFGQSQGSFRRPRHLV